MLSCGISVCRLPAMCFYSVQPDLLYSKPVNSTTGYTSISSNIGTLENRGVELALTGKILTGDFKWTLSGNISFVKTNL